MSIRAEPDSIQDDVKDNTRVDYVEDSPSSKESMIESRDEELLSSERRPAAEKALVRKLDMRLLPTIVLVFILNYIDV